MSYAFHIPPRSQALPGNALSSRLRRLFYVLFLVGGAFP